MIRIVVSHVISLDPALSAQVDALIASLAPDTTALQSAMAALATHREALLAKVAEATPKE